MNGLAYLGKVTSIGLIPGADFIVHATVDCDKGGRWAGVVRKDEVHEGQVVEVFLPDSILPAIPRFAFMEQKKYRVRQARFKGCPSTCLIMPTDLDLPLGSDITEVCGVVKYEKVLPASMSGIARGNFPGFIPKTDEVLYQKAWHLIDFLKGEPYYVTTKYDGSSGTAYLKDGHFGVCSRNLELKEEGGSVWWEVAKKYNLQAALEVISPMRDLAVQFEVVGPGIQGNPLGLAEREIRIFDLFDITKGLYFGLEAIRNWCRGHGLPMVEVIEAGDSFGYGDAATIEPRLLQMAETPRYPNGKPAEGVVIRAQFPRFVGADRLSFKVINLNYKD